MADTSAVARVLVYHRAAGYVHASIPDAVAALRGLGAQHGFIIDATDEPDVFTEAMLSTYSAVVFVQTTGDVIERAQHRAALERYVREGGGWYGLHGASCLDPRAVEEWPFARELVGARFVGHPRGCVPATIRVEDADSPMVRRIADGTVLTDEWYSFDVNPRPLVHVVATVDESTYEPEGWAMGADHPIMWHQRIGHGRSVYNAMGHLPETWSDPAFVDSVLGGIELATHSVGVHRDTA